MSNNSNSAIRVEMLSLKRIFKFLDEQIFAVPQIQREFVWNGKRAAKLFDSIYRGIPVGTVLIWDTDNSRRNMLRENWTILPPYDSTANKNLWYLIDGQQRVSVIHRCRQGDRPPESKVDFGRICFALSPYEDEEETFAYRSPVDRRYVSVTDLLKPNWNRKFRQLPSGKFSKLADCRERLLGYKIPFVFNSTNDVDRVRETFIRINSGGMRVKSADEMFARASLFKLRDLAKAARQNLKGFEDIDYSTILLGFEFASGGKDPGKTAIGSAIKRWDKKLRGKKIKLQDFNKFWRDYEEALKKAVNFLRENCKVQNTRFLPSESMLATLSFFYFRHGLQQTTRQRHELLKWFWATGICGRYSGLGYYKNMPEDLKFFERLAKDERSKFKFEQRVLKSDISKAVYTSTSATTGAFFCLLASLEPRTIKNGEKVPLGDLVVGWSDKKNDHHIFPKSLLRSKGFLHKEYNSVCNICFLTAEDNLFILKRKPSDYMRESKKESNPCFGTTMKSHLIPHDKESAIWTPNISTGYKLFRRQRLNMICRAFETKAGMKLFRED
jgi:hypothetical protein